MALISVPAAAQDEPRAFAGALFGVSALSADAQAVTTGADAAVSLYDPKNGLALNVFGGFMLLNTSRSRSTGCGTGTTSRWFPRTHRLKPVVFMSRPETVRNMRWSSMASSTFDGWTARFGHTWEQACRSVRFSSEEGGSLAQGLTPPAGEIRSTHIGLRSHVGIDFRLSRHISFRYSFSETISSNPISPSLTPPGRRPLMNFQNLFGFVSRF